MGTFIEDNCEFVEWSRPLIENCSDFSCTHDKDIELSLIHISEPTRHDFFKNDFENYNNQLLGKSYGFVKANTSLELVAAFTVSNSMLPVSSLPKNIKNKINRPIPNIKRNSQYPAVLVGQLAVFDSFAGKHIGDEILSFIKGWFIDPLNKTGCRYIIVDASNHQKVIDFYQRNGFKFIFENIADEIEYMKLDLEPEYKRTRLMYFDLIILKS